MPATRQSSQTFPSKVDGWLIPVLVLTGAGMLVALIGTMLAPMPWIVRLIVVAGLVILTFVLFSVLRSTYYEVGASSLRVVSGPFRWTIPIADIVEITPSRNPLSSPALSLDRLKVRFGKRKFLLVSPADKEGFRLAIERAQAR